MAATFRESMNWLHTWAGVVVGGLLFAIFWTGTLSVFDREIDRWMKPATRLEFVEVRSVDRLAAALGPEIAKWQPWWLLFLPTEREPFARVTGYPSPGKFASREANPSTGEFLPDSGTRAGTGFLFPFHFSLNLWNRTLGYWIVGFASMAMMALCVSGVVIHKKIFADFFTFRAGRRPRRLILDLHNVTGVLGLPFYFVISFSGLVIFFSTYFPAVIDLTYGSRGAFNRDGFGLYSRAKANVPGGPVVSLDGIMQEAAKLWRGGEPSLVRVWHPGDANSYVEVRRSYENSVTMTLDMAYFDAATGKLLHSFSARPVMTAQRFISGLHFIQFRHWTLRWVYFGLGLTGCILIATGFLFWLESRRKKHGLQPGLKGVQVVDGLAVGSVTGMILATCAFFAINRLLPLNVTFAGADRASLEIWTFYMVWLASFAHAWTRPTLAWIEQCWAIAALSLAAVTLNWVTTGDHPGTSLATARLHAVAGVDLLLLASALASALVAVRLRRRQIVAQTGTRPAIR